MFVPNTRRGGGGNPRLECTSFVANACNKQPYAPRQCVVCFTQPNSAPFKSTQLNSNSTQLNSMMQRKTDEASALQKRLHHFALESGSGRDKAQAYASSLTPGGSKPRTPGGYRTPSKGQRSPGLSTPHRRARTPAGVTPTGGRSQQRQLVEVQVST